MGIHEEVGDAFSLQNAVDPEAVPVDAQYRRRPRPLGPECTLRQPEPGRPEAQVSFTGFETDPKLRADCTVVLEQRREPVGGKTREQFDAPGPGMRRKRTHDVAIQPIELVQQGKMMVVPPFRQERESRLSAVGSRPRDPPTQPRPEPIRKAGSRY